MDIRLRALPAPSLCLLPTINNHALFDIGQASLVAACGFFGGLLLFWTILMCMLELAYVSCSLLPCHSLGCS